MALRPDIHPASARPIELRRAQSRDDLQAAAALFREYADSLDVDLCFQGFEAELESLPGEYGPPGGFLMLASVAGGLAGCGAFRALTTVDHVDACEMKRLYVRPAFRGSRVGRAMASALLGEARRAGYATMLLGYARRDGAGAPALCLARLHGGSSLLHQPDRRRTLPHGRPHMTGSTR